MSSHTVTHNRQQPSRLRGGVLWMGLYPKPFTDVMHASVVELLRHVAVTKLAN